MGRISIGRLLFLLVVSIIIALSIRASISRGETRVFGQDFLAAQYPRFNGTKALPYIASNSALGTLDNTFGTSTAPIRALLTSGKFSSYRVHLINGSCIANGNCGPYEPLKDYTLKAFNRALENNNPKIISYLKDRTAIYCALQKDFPLVDFYISPVLEHRLSVKAYRNAANAVKDTCPIVTLVNNPVTGNGERYRGALLESHDGFNKPRDIVSFDGFDATDADIQKWMVSTKDSKISFIWSRVYNCRNQGPWEDPRERTSCPKPRDFEMLAHITDFRGPAPSSTLKCAAFKSPSIWKPLAEDKGTGDIRANLPVAIVALSAADVTVSDYRGKPLGTLKYFGAYANGLNRYYSGTGSKLSGYQFEKKAVKISSYPWTYLIQGKKCIGPFIGGRRGGAYR